MYSEELEHHGILGQKWGIRRFQRKDGTLTAAGKKRRREEDSSGNEKETSKGSSGQEAASSKPAKKKKVSDLTDDELKARVNRLQMEKQALDLEKQISALNPKKVSAGKKFVNEMGGKVLLPAIRDSAKSSLTAYLTKTMKKSLGVDEGDTKEGLKALEKEFKSKNFKKQINELNKYFENENDSDLKNLEKEFKIKDLKKKIKDLDKNLQDDDDSDTEDEAETLDDGTVIDDPEPPFVDVDFENVNAGRDYVQSMLGGTQTETGQGRRHRRRGRR